MESPFATVRAETDITNRPASREAGGNDCQVVRISRGEVEEIKRLSAGPLGEGRFRFVNGGVSLKKQGAESGCIIRGVSVICDKPSVEGDCCCVSGVFRG